MSIFFKNFGPYSKLRTANRPVAWRKQTRPYNKRTYLLTPLPNVNFPGVTPVVSRRHIKHLPNSLSLSRSQGITKQKRPAIYDKASLRKDTGKSFTEKLNVFQVKARSKQTKEISGSRK